MFGRQLFIFLYRTFTISRYLTFTCLIFFVSFNLLFWSYVVHRRSDNIINDLTKEALTKIAINPNYSAIIRKVNKLPKNLKYTLFWTPSDYAPFYFFETGQRAFLKYSCPHHNCYVTDDRDFFPNITQFHAIAFNGRNLGIPETELPQIRSNHQKYIYYNTESARYYPLYQPYFDNYFNWTSTFKIKSDLVINYFQAIGKDQDVVAPKLSPDWIQFENMSPVDDFVSDIVKFKSRAAAWFVSNCGSYSKRKEYVKTLQKELEFYNLTIDVYGDCGNYECPKYKENICMAKLEKDYFFYLAFENSVDEDYVTEKVLKGLNHFTVPIVYGGADYERFLPPHSYINATQHKQKDLARLIAKLMRSPNLYMDYFRWTNHYRYRLHSIETTVCSLCSALNDEKKMAYSLYPELRRWWNPNFKDIHIDG